MGPQGSVWAALALGSSGATGRTVSVASVAPVAASGGNQRDSPPIKALLPIPILIALWPLVRRFFRATWEELDAEARRLRLEAPLTEYDYRRPVACFAIVAVVLTLQ